jgi:uncharacterized membrane protein
VVKKNKTALLICLLFFAAYSILSVVRHAHYGSYGFDLGIADQIVWEYSRFQAPVTTIDHIPFIPELFVHLEFIYILLAPFYWIFSNVNTLLILQAFAVAVSGLPIFYIARKHKLNKFLSVTLLISYLSFYGVQNALWFDVHSTAFGVSFLAWFIYFVDSSNFYASLVTFLLTISCKENYAGMTLLISLVYLFYKKDKRQLIFTGLSLLYLLIAFGFYFPHVGGYRFQSKQGLLGGMSLMDFFNTAEKRQVIFYTLAWTGFLSILQPIFLLPLVGNLASYFILGRDVSTAQGLFLQYRIELTPLLFLATIYGLLRFRKLNKAWTGAYILICALVFQYSLHLPLSYLTKSWFWQQPPSVKDINTVLVSLPPNASVVAQDNIIPHISQRKQIFTLYPTTKDFKKNSPCGRATCEWFSWAGTPAYLVVDTATDWDARGFLTDREDFIAGLENLEKKGIIKAYFCKNDACIYKVLKKP